MHDEGRILVAFLTQGIELSNSIVESLFGKMASLVRRVEDLVIEDGEVEGKTKSDWVCRSKIGLSNFGSILVGFQRFVGRLLSLFGDGEFCEVSMVITLPVKIVRTALV